MSAEELARALGGRRTGSSWMARCPAHDDREPSLSISGAHNGKMLVRCHAGCDQQRVISILRARGLWTDAPRRWGAQRTRHAGTTETLGKAGLRRGAVALAIWDSSTTARGSLVETYLSTRGINLPAPDSLRFCARLKHPSGGKWPTMVALVTNGAGGTPIAIHRTFLARDAGGKAPVDPAKMMLGPCRGGAVRLSEPGAELMVGEGIETCMAAMQATGKPAFAALSTSGLRSLDLPRDIRDVIVLADGDEPGEAAARDCALRWRREGRRVRIARPPHGLDFNDVLMGRASRVEERVR